MYSRLEQNQSLETVTVKHTYQFRSQGPVQSEVVAWVLRREHGYQSEPLG